MYSQETAGGGGRPRRPRVKTVYKGGASPNPKEAGKLKKRGGGKKDRRISIQLRGLRRRTSERSGDGTKGIQITGGRKINKWKKDCLQLKKGKESEKRQIRSPQKKKKSSTTTGEGFFGGGFSRERGEEMNWAQTEEVEVGPRFFWEDGRTNWVDVAATRVLSAI